MGDANANRLPDFVTFRNLKHQILLALQWRKVLTPKLSTKTRQYTRDVDEARLTRGVIVLCTELDAESECDRQATVVGRLLTSSGDDGRAVAKLFLVQRLEESSRANYAYFWI